MSENPSVGIELAIPRWLHYLLLASRCLVYRTAFAAERSILRRHARAGNIRVRRACRSFQREKAPVLPSHPSCLMMDLYFKSNAPPCPRGLGLFMSYVDPLLVRSFCSSVI